MSEDKKDELDEYGVWVKTPPHDPAEDEPVQESQLPDFDFINDMISTNETGSGTNETNVPQETDDVSSPAETEETLTESSSLVSGIDSMETQDIPADIDLSVFDAPVTSEDASQISEENQVSEISTEETAAPEENPASQDSQETDFSSLMNSADGEIDLDAFMDSASSPDGEISLDSFMDSSSGSSSSDGEVSLDDFFSSGDGDISLDAFGLADPEEKPQEIEDQEPLDIQLSFDDTIEQGVQSDENKKTSTEQNLSFTDFMDESEAKDLEEDKKPVENFDDVFENIVDETPAAESTQDTAASIGSGDEIDLSEFGIIDDGEQKNVTIGDGSEKKTEETQDFEMSVSTEDDPNQNEETTQEVIEEGSSSQDEDIVDLNIDTEAQEKPAEQKTDFSSPDDDFDLDSILNSVEDENGNEVTFSGKQKTAEETPEPEEKKGSFFSEETEKTAEEIPESVKSEIQEIAEAEESVSDLEIAQKTISENLTDSETVKEEPVMTEENLITEESGFAEIETNEIPDTFDEEASSLTQDDKEEITADNLDEDIHTNSLDDSELLVRMNTNIIQPPVTEKKENENTMNSEENLLLKQIASELASLKGEISTLKNQFETMKNTQEAEPSIEIPEPAQEESTGFFTDDGIDDTIALSGDELNNILNTAEFTVVQAETETADQMAPADDTVPAQEENVEEPAVEEMACEETEPAVSEETLAEEEAVFQDLQEPVIADDDQEITAEPVSEIEEDIETEQDSSLGIADSISDNFEVDFDNDNLDEPDLEQESFAEQEQDLPDEIEVPKEDDILVESSSTDFITEEETVQNAEEPQLDEAPEVERTTIDELSKPIDLFEEEDTPLSEEKLDYLDQDPSSKEKPEEISEIDESPVDNVFDTWESTSTEEPVPETESEIVADEPEESEPVVEADETGESGPAVETDEIGESEPAVEADEIHEIQIPEEDEIVTVESLEEKAAEQATVEEEAAQEMTEPVIEENDFDEEAPVEDVFSTWESSSEQTASEASGLTAGESQPEPVVMDVDFETDDASEPAETEQDLSAGIGAIETFDIDETIDDISSSAVIEEDDAVADHLISETESAAPVEPAKSESQAIPSNMKEEIKSVLCYMDQLLENLPEDKIEEFAKSKQFETYKKLFEELGIS